MVEPIANDQKARRLARAIISDISIYNQAKIREGIEHDNLYERLKDELEEGRSLYEARVASDLRQTTNFFNEAICDVLLKPNAHLDSDIW